jgi:hypothetical protein
MEKKMKSYYIHLENGEWRKVKGHKLRIKGFEDLDLFYHKKGRYYYISEGKTGAMVTDSGFYTLSVAKERAKNRIIKAKENGILDKAINEGIKKYGLSPRYRSKNEQIQSKR